MTQFFQKPNRRILVIDDNPAIHADFKKILCPTAEQQASLDAFEAEFFGNTKLAGKPETFHVDSALQGQAGFELVRQSLADRQPYAMVFMDVRMPPGWDGIETTAKIWEIDPDIQVVICTAYSDYSWEDMMAKLGISDQLVILKKPFDNVEVLQLAHALSEKWNLLQQANAKMDELEAVITQRTRELQDANEQLRAEMTERLRTEEALRQSQKMEALGQLAGGIAHDFNNLLTVIRGYSRSLISDTQASTEVMDGLTQIDRAAERAANLTSQMLMFSRKKRMRPERLNLNTTLTQSGKMLRRLLNEDIELQIHCPATPLTVHADPVMLEQSLLNLAVNARDAMPAGGRLTIHASENTLTTADASLNPRARPGSFACITVTDTGSGISATALPHLFEPFFTTKEPGQGTGLGLATVYGIVKQHQGWIEVESQPGQGARFKIFLPLLQNAECGMGNAELTPHSAHNPPHSTELPRGTETILLVEDEAAVRRLAKGFLERLGYHVLEAASGKDALALWHEPQTQVDLLLTDMVMPEGVSGRELAARLHQQKPDLKVIYTTGYSVDAIGAENITPAPAPSSEFPVQSSGLANSEPGTRNFPRPARLVLEEGTNFLAKPYHLHHLASTVRRCLDGARQPQT